MKIKRANKAVSEIMGTVLLLGISVSLFSVVYIFVINETMDPSAHPPAVYIIGTTEEKEVILENRGQEPLSADSTVMLVIAGNQLNLVVRDYLNDTNGDGYWNIGERLVFNASSLGIDIIGLQVRATVIDAKSGALVMTGIIQDGEVFEFPYVLTSSASDIESDRATLWMKYNFRNNTGDLRFAFRKATEDWNYTTWFSGQTGEGSYGKMVTGLTPETVYLFKAQLRYNNETIEDVTLSFTTPGVIVGMWHFDTGSGTIAVDSSGRDNHGTLFYGPQWTTGINGTALNYDGIDDYVEVPYNPSLDIPDKISIETWMKPLENNEGYYGQIISSVLDTSSFGLFNIYDPDITHVSGDIYAVVCRGDGNDGFLVTLEIANDGHINYTLVDIFEFSTNDCYEPDIIHVDGTIFAIAYRSGWVANVRTVEIFTDGSINRTIKDTSPFATTYRESHIFYVDGNVYGVGYTGLNNDGYFTTIGISNNGQITGVIDTVVFDRAVTGYSEEPNMIHVYGDIYAIAYRNPDSDGALRTLDIADDGQITAPSHFDGEYIDSFPFDIFDGFEPNITHVDGNIYAICYGGFKSVGTLRTVEIYNDGTIKQDIINTSDFDTDNGREPSIIHINGDVYAIAYRGPDNDGWLKTVKIASNGVIDSNIIDSYEFDTSACYDPSILRIYGDFYAIAYRGAYDDGLLKTVQIANNGTISKPVIDYAEFGIFDFQQPDIIQISDNIYALAFRGFDNDGYLRTVEIASDGQINDSIINSFKFHSGQILDPMIIHISGEFYAIAYSDYQSSWHGFLKTVRINSFGYIIGGVIDSLEFETTQGIRPAIVHVSGDVYAITYRGPSDYGYVKTVNIFSNGQISTIAMASATQTFVASTCYYPDIIHASGEVYAIAYTGSGWDGYLKTVKIANDGAITTTGMDTLEFDTSYCVFSNIINVTADVYGIAYTGPSNDGYVKTVRIDNNGMIVGGVIDTLEFDTSHGYRPDIIHIKGRVYAIVHAGSGWDGYVKTLRIGENGDIANSLDGNYEFSTGDSRECRIIHVNGSIFAIAYRNNYLDGMIRTVEIKYTPTVGYIIARSNCYRINANSTTVFAYINDMYLTAPISSGFNYVVLTYDENAGGSDQMKLYINTTLVNWTTYSTSITTNNNNLYFGWLNSIVDEVTLWRSILTQSEINNHYNDHTGG